MVRNILVVFRRVRLLYATSGWSNYGPFTSGNDMAPYPNL